MAIAQAWSCMDGGSTQSCLMELQNKSDRRDELCCDRGRAQFDTSVLPGVPTAIMLCRRVCSVLVGPSSSVGHAHAP